MDALHEPIRLIVADDLLARAIPRQLSPDAIRDVAEPIDDVRAVPVLDVSDGAMARLHAVEEIADVWPVLLRRLGVFRQDIGRIVEPGLTAVGGSPTRRLLLFLDTTWLRRQAESAAIDEERALRAMELHAEAAEASRTGVAIEPVGVLAEDRVVKDESGERVARLQHVRDLAGRGRHACADRGGSPRRIGLQRPEHDVGEV